MLDKEFETAEAIHFENTHLRSRGISVQAARNQPRKDGGKALNFCADLRRNGRKRITFTRMTKNVFQEIVQNPMTTTHALMTSSQVQHIGFHEVIDATCYSSWKKLLHVTTYVVQFFRRTGFERSLNLDTEELRHTEEFWIKSKEYQSFQDEMCHMMSTAKTPVPLLI